MMFSKKFFNVGDLVKVKNHNGVGVIFEKKESGKLIHTLSGKCEPSFTYMILIEEKEIEAFGDEIVKI